jgi:hypothetical protein
MTRVFGRTGKSRAPSRNIKENIESQIANLGCDRFDSGPFYSEAATGLPRPPRCAIAESYSTQGVASSSTPRLIP